MEAQRSGQKHPPKGRYQVLTRLYPEHNISDILKKFRHESAEEIAELIRSTPDAFKKKSTGARSNQGHDEPVANAKPTKPDPRKRPPVRRRVWTNANAPDLPIQQNDSPEVQEAVNAENLVFPDLLRDLFGHYTRLKTKIEPRIALGPDNVRCLCIMFPNLKVAVFHGAFYMNQNICATIIICWFVSNGLLPELIKLLKMRNVPKWANGPMKDVVKREVDLDNVPDYFRLYPDVITGFTQFKEIMASLSQKYPELLKGAKLQKAGHTFSCLVCFEDVDIKHQLRCGKSNSADRHSFCRECLKSQAKAASEEMPLSEGAVGLKCMDPNCKNPIYINNVQDFIPRDIRKKIDERMTEENLALSGLTLERCRDCNYAFAVDEDGEGAMLFDCADCKVVRCRHCGRKWDEDHYEYSCEELDQKEKVDRTQRDLDARKNDIVVRKCHRCNVQFVKSEGCNKMECRCGAKQCYICRQEITGYDHFCQHQERQQDQPCQLCNACHLFEDATKRDDREIQEMQAARGEPQQLAPPAQREVGGNLHEVGQARNHMGNRDEYGFHVPPQPLRLVHMAAHRALLQADEQFRLEGENRLRARIAAVAAAQRQAQVVAAVAQGRADMEAQVVAQRQALITAEAAAAQRQAQIEAEAAARRQARIAAEAAALRQRRIDAEAAARREAQIEAEAAVLRQRRIVAEAAALRQRRIDAETAARRQAQIEAEAAARRQARIAAEARRQAQIEAEAAALRQRRIDAETRRRAQMEAEAIARRQARIVAAAAEARRQEQITAANAARQAQLNEIDQILQEHMRKKLMMKHKV